MKKSGILLLALVVLFFGCTNKDEAYFDPRGTDYAGAESCIQCHKATAHEAMSNAHFKATAPGNPENVSGNFSDGQNVFVADENTKLVMEKRNDSLYQVLYRNGKEVHAFKIDVVFGNKKAQTSAYWRNNNTYELPVSYYKSIHGWATSPGYPAKNPNFERIVEKDCYACHSSNVNSRLVLGKSTDNGFSTMDMENILNKKTIIYGIDCERCHGPAKSHVDHHLKFPNEKTGQHIIKYKALTNQQKFDACAICHSGISGMKIKSRFEFKPGDNLSDYYRSALTYNMDSNTDVHGNQAGLLSQSKCFKESNTINCLTCHDPHKNSNENAASYASICISCHKTETHKPTPGISLATHCVTCHMPKQSSKDIRFQLSGKNEFEESSYNLRSHRIAIYPDDNLTH